MALTVLGMALFAGCDDRRLSAAQKAPMAAAVAKLTAGDTSAADFGAGTATGVDTTSAPGSITLTARSPWWNDTFHYRFSLDVAAGALPRADYPVEVPVDLPALLTPTGSALDPDSVRVIEVDGAGATIAEAPSRYDESGAAKNGYLVFPLSGSTAASASRRYQIYVDTQPFGPKPPAGYHKSLAQRSLSNGTVQWGGFGQSQSGQLAPLAFTDGIWVSSGVDHVFVRHNKVNSSDGDFGSQSDLDGYTENLAAAAYTEVSAPTTLVDEPAFKLNRMVAQAGNLRLTQYTVVTTGNGARMTVAIDNTGAATITSGTFIDCGDYDVLGAKATDDRSAWNATDGIIYGWDTKTPGDIGFRAFTAPAAFQADDRLNIWTTAFNNALNNLASFGPGDMGLALQFSLPTLNPADRHLIQQSFAISPSGYAGIAPTILNLASPPGQTRGVLEGRYGASGSFESRVFDSGDPAPVWKDLSYVATVPAGAALTLQTRTGASVTPDATWSAWSSAVNVTGSGSFAMSSPNSRYIQYRAALANTNAGGSTPVLDEVTVTASVKPTQLSFTTPTSTPSVVAGDCTPVFTVQAQDPQGAPGNVTADVQVNLSSTSAGGAFYGDAACGVSVAGPSVTILAPGTTATFYYKDTLAGAPAITAAAAGLTSATASVTVTAAPVIASQLVFTTPSRSFVAGACPGASGVISVQLQDASGMPAAAGSGGQPFTVSSSSAGPISWFADSSCATAVPGGGYVIPAGSTQVAVYYRDLRAGTPTLNLSSPSGLANPTPQQHSVTAVATRVVFTTAPRTFVAGACPGNSSLITAQLQDDFGNPATAPAGGFSLTANSTSTGAVSWFNDSACQSAATSGAFTIPAGTSSVDLYYRDTRAGAPAIALASALLAPSPQTHTVVANMATGLVFTTPAPQTFIAGACSGAPAVISVELRDDFGNPAPAPSPGVPLTASSSSTGTVSWYSDPGCATAAAGGAFTVGTGSTSVNLYYVDTLAGTPLVSITSALMPPAAQQHLVRPAAAQRLVFLTPSRTFTAGECPGAALAITVQQQDEFGNPVRAGASGQPLTASSTATSTSSWFVDDACATAATGGDYTIGKDETLVDLFYRDTLAGSPSISLSNSSGLANPAPQPQTVVAGVPPEASFIISPAAGGAPLLAAFDGSGSTADPSTSLLSWQWDFGDQSPLAEGVVTSHRYVLPGGYLPTLTVTDAFGRQASARRAVQALDASGGTPPLARIVASQLAGADALTVDFSCDCTEGAAPIVFYRWEFAEGAAASGSRVSHAFAPGRYRVRLIVMDSAGRVAHDSVQVSVSRQGALPPECRLSTAPPAGPAPLSTDLLSTFRDPDGITVRNEVIFPDGERTGALQLSRAYEQPGRYTARLEVEDDQGLICEDRVEISATGPGGALPPRILSVASTTASCGVAYRYSETGLLVASGSGPLRFSVEGAQGAPAPQGLAVDPSTGEVFWTPGEVDGRVSAVLRVDGPGGTALQPLEVDVDCPQARAFEYPVACSCDASAGLPLVFLLAALVARRRQRCTR